jgi:Sulfatase
LDNCGARARGAEICYAASPQHDNGRTRGSVLRGKARAALRGAVGLLRPPLVGVLYFELCALLGLVSTLEDDRIQGVHAKSVQHLIATHFSGEVTQVALMVLALAALIGGLLGAVAGLLVRLRARLAGRSPCSPERLAGESLAVIVAAHAIFFMHDVAMHPALYQRALYSHGGVLRAVQLLGTEVLGPAGISALGAFAFVAWFAVALRPWETVRARIRAASSHMLAPRPIAVGALAVILLAVELASGGPRRVAEASRHPNVLLIATDSLRNDHVVPRYAPHMAALAAHGVRFEHAYVSLPRTFPSWVTIATGRYPHHHGVRNMFPRWEERAVDLHPMPRSFQRAGYFTAVVSDFAGDIFRRVDLGFSYIDTPTFNMSELIRERTLDGQLALLPFLGSDLARRMVPSLRELPNDANADAVTSDALAAIDRAGSRPFFVTVFYSSVHFPYAAPAPYYQRFTDRHYDGRFRYDKAELLGREAPPNAADVKQVRGLYDGAVSAVDDAVARLLAGLKARGLDRDTIIVVTADHGESLYEPGRGQGHGDHLFGDEATHVPLAVYDPSRPNPRSVDQIVESVDIAPTLCELAKVRCPTGMDGRSLLPLMDGKTLPARPAFAETGLWFTESIPEVPLSLRLPYPDLPHVTEVLPDHDDEIVMRKRFEPLTLTAKHRMVRERRYKLIYIPTRDGVKWMLFDTIADPGETKNVIGAHPDVARRLKAELWHWMLEDPKMQREHGYLLPRASAWSEESPKSDAVRLGPKASP